MIINPKYEYAALERVTAEDGVRHYVCPITGQKLPSVTTILSATSDKTFLKEWVERVGEKKADEIKKAATNLGTLMHTHLECYIQGIDRPRGNNLIRLQSSRMADVIIEKGLCNVDEVWGIEVGMYLPSAFAGTTDLVGIHSGTEAIMDFKTAKKLRTKEQVYDYMDQLAAYAVSHNEVYGTNIRKGVVFMVDRELNYREFVLEGEEFDNHVNSFLNRFATYEEKTLGKPFLA